MEESLERSHTHGVRVEIAHSVRRIEEIEAVLSSLDLAWLMMDDGHKRLVLADARRGLIDVACTLNDTKEKH